jgi:autotransporter strand-loop-strand O-heptosyltransferase
MKILIVNPHLSTGGCPEYLYQFILNNKNKYEAIKVIEFSNFSNDYVIQKNKIKNLIGEENVICLGDFWEDDFTFQFKKFKLLNIIQEYNPDVVWFNEFPECFEYKSPPEELMKKIYSPNRAYKIIETTHNNSFDFDKKIFIPDEFMFCSELHLEKSKNINIIKSIWEVPISNNVRPNRENTLELLGLDPSYLHVLNVGIFNQNKNQKYIFDLAEKLKHYKIQFHFIGNSCFLNECDIPQDQLLLHNCKVWGERSDVDFFMSCMDMFLFPSNKELNPLSVKEALSWNMEVVCKKCTNYTDKYLEKNNFYLIDDINTSEFILQKLKNLNTKPLNENNEIKFALYTSFYNSAKYVNAIFDNILNLKYNNFTWFITDDFSADNTKDLILDKLKTLKTDKIKYVEQQFKKQMYWQPNAFMDKSFEYIVAIDADDFFDLNFLCIYNKFLSNDKSICLMTCDFKKIEESNGNLHSLGLLNNNEVLKSKINKFHPSVDYLNNLNYYSLGYLRCFKNIKDLEFLIKDFNACANDSYHIMYVNSYGKWLHIPRNLYTWMYRPDSESHSPISKGFNNNFDIAYKKLINSESLVDTTFISLYKETCALNYLDLNFNESVSIFTKNQNAKLLNDLFFDKNLTINNNFFHDVYVIVLNYYDTSEIKNIISSLKNKNARIIFYKLYDDKYISNEERDTNVSNGMNDLKNNLSSFVNINNWFSYIRHFYIVGNVNKNINLDSQEINICNESGSLGDAIAWVPIVNEFALQKRKKVNYYTPHKELFINEYPMINFYDYCEKPSDDEKDVYKIGCFNESDWKPYSLQEVASNILGIKHEEKKCKLNFDKTKKSNFNKKYVCIATQSTAQCKYWNNKEGWTKVVSYLNSLGYDVVCIDKHYGYGAKDVMNIIPKNVIDKTGDLPLEDRINDLYHCEFFIGLGSGLSWLAWACEKSVVMISGFSDPKSEFYTPYRVHNKNVCNSCWSDVNCTFDRSNWLWCPRDKNFECSREITFDMVKEKIDRCILDLENKNNDFEWLKIDNSFEDSVKKEIFENKIYEKVKEVSEGDIVVDLGASVGPFVMSILNKNPKHVYAVESSLEMFSTLKSNMKNYKNVTCLNYAIDNNGADFCENDFSYIFHDKSYECKAITFKTLLNKLNINKIDFLKIDIEGSEYGLFSEDCLNILKSNVKFLVAEFHLGNNDFKNKFRDFRDTAINKFKNYNIYSLDGADIKWDLYNDHFLQYYTEVIIHIEL